MFFALPTSRFRYITWECGNEGVFDTLKHREPNLQLFFMKGMLSTKVCIIGAGPGGATAALHLAQLGIESKYIPDKLYSNIRHGTLSFQNSYDSQ